MLNIGIICCSALIFISVIELFNPSFIQQIPVSTILNVLHLACFIIVWAIIRNLLVSVYKQKQVKFVVDAFISITLILIISKNLNILFVGNIKWLFLFAGIVDFAIFYLLLFKIMEINSSEVPKIEILKNYAILMSVTIFLLLVLTIFREFYLVNVNQYINHLLILFPNIFLLFFLFSTKRLAIT